MAYLVTCLCSTKARYLTGERIPSTGLPARLLTGRAPRTRAWLNPMRPYRALAGCRLGRSSRRGGYAIAAGGGGARGSDDD